MYTYKRGGVVEWKSARRKATRTRDGSVVTRYLLASRVHMHSGIHIHYTR